jgi:hypothetical protein
MNSVIPGNPYPDAGPMSGNGDFLSLKNPLVNKAVKSTTWSVRDRDRIQALEARFGFAKSQKQAPSRIDQEAGLSIDP